MELALAGIPGAADGSMPVSEFSRWNLYAQRNLLPWRRIQLQLALIAMIIAQSMGGATDAKIEDYLFDPSDDDSSMTEEEEAAVAMRIFG